MANKKQQPALSLPRARCLSKQHAAEYLGIGVTLLAEIGVPSIKLGRRILYDVLDLDRWLDQYKHRGRAEEEVLWPEKKDSIVEKTRLTGGLMYPCQTDDEYVKVLDLKS